MYIGSVFVTWFVCVCTGCWERLKAGGAGMTEDDEMVGWHHRLDEYEFEQALGVGDGRMWQAM